MPHKPFISLSVVCTPPCARGHFGNMIPMLSTRLVRRAGFISCGASDAQVSFELRMSIRWDLSTASGPADQASQSKYLPADLTQERRPTYMNSHR